jgi:hypothetical protein
MGKNKKRQSYGLGAAKTNGPRTQPPQHSEPVPAWGKEEVYVQHGSFGSTMQTIARFGQRTVSKDLCCDSEGNIYLALEGRTSVGLKCNSIFHVEAGTHKVTELPIHQFVHCIAVSPDGQHLYTATGSTIRRYTAPWSEGIEAQQLGQVQNFVVQMVATQDT